MRDKIEKLAETHIGWLTTFPNVVGCGYGTKLTSGRDTGRPCLAVFVRKKIRREELEPEELVPTEVEGVETDVVEVGEVFMQAKMAEVSPKSAVRPLKGGVSVGPLRYLVSGTIGLPLVWQDRTPCLLTNNHVIRLDFLYEGKPGKGYPVTQPSMPDGGTEEEIAGELYDWVGMRFSDKGEPNSVDAAIASLKVDAVPEVLAIGEYQELGEPEVGMAIQKYGRTTGLTEGRVAYTGVNILVNYGAPDRMALMLGQCLTEYAMSEPGDSGSAVFEKGTEKVIGLLFAGSPATSVFTPIKKVFRELRLWLHPPYTVELGQFLKSIWDKIERCWLRDIERRKWHLVKPWAEKKRAFVGDVLYFKLKEEAVFEHNGVRIKFKGGWNQLGVF